MQSESSSEPSTLPTDTPESPKTGFRYHFNNFNQAIPKKLVDYKVIVDYLQTILLITGRRHEMLYRLN